MAIKEAFTTHQSLTETIDGRLIGRVILEPQKVSVGKTPQAQAIEARLTGDAYFQRSIANKLNNNSSSLKSETAGVERGVSAYYTWNPEDRTVIVEWGEIGPTSEAKLHDYLNRMIDYHDRHKKGMVVRSGHMSRFPSCGTVICLMDTIYQAEPIVEMLNYYGFVVIDSMGCVQNPSSNESADMRKVG